MLKDTLLSPRPGVWPGKMPRLRRRRIQQVLADEVKAEILRSIRGGWGMAEDWDTILYAADHLPLSLTMCRKPVKELEFLQEVRERLLKRDFEEARRSQSRKGSEKRIRKKQNIYYDIVFKRGREKVGYGTLIQINLTEGRDPAQCGGYVLAVKVESADGEEKVSFEGGRFSSYEKEVKPLVNEIGDLYRKL